MASSTILILALMSFLLISSMPKQSDAQSKPNCVSQFTLANQACVQIPLEVVSMNQNNTRVNATSDSNDDDGEDDDNGGNDDSERRARHRHGHGHAHEHGHGDDQEHEPEHGHRSRHMPAVYTDCCRWVEDIDEACICAALLRLPPFLTRLQHNFMVEVMDTCDRTFKCHGV